MYEVKQRPQAASRIIVQMKKNNDAKKILQLEKKIIGGRDSLQLGLIGINLMPSGKLMELLPGNGRGYDEISGKISGHTSIISGSATSTKDPMRLSKGMGFSPNGLLGSLIVGLYGFILNGSQKNVLGKYHSESQGIVDDIKANQLLTRVTLETQKKWEKKMGDEVKEGIYSFNPERGLQDEFDKDEFDKDKGSDNCTTKALRKAIDICAELMFDTTVPLMDRYNIDQFEKALEDMVNHIVEENKRNQTAKGTQGRALGAFNNVIMPGNPIFNDHGFDDDDGFGLLLPPEERW